MDFNHQQKRRWNQLYVDSIKNKPVLQASKLKYFTGDRERNSNCFQNINPLTIEHSEHRNRVHRHWKNIQFTRSSDMDTSLQKELKIIKSHHGKHIQTPNKSLRKKANRSH